MREFDHSFFDDVHLYPADDGWTLPGYFEAVPNLHGPMRFRYRPFTRPEKDALLSIAQSNGQAVDARMAETVASRIKSWNVKEAPTTKDSKPAVAPINAASVKQLAPLIWQRLLGLIVYGSDPGDRDPAWSEQDKKSHDAAVLNALATGGSVSDAMIDELEKNS